MNTSLEGSKSSAGAESQVAVAPVEGMSAYGGSRSGSFVAVMLFALPTLVAGQPGDGGRRDQDGDFGAVLFFLRAASGLHCDGDLGSAGMHLVPTAPWRETTGWRKGRWKGTRLLQSRHG